MSMIGASSKVCMTTNVTCSLKIEFVVSAYRIMDVSPLCQFAPWTIRHLDVSPPGRFAPWTIRHLLKCIPKNFFL